MTAVDIPEDLMLAERVVIGTAISSRGKAEKVGDVIRPEHFLRPAHQIMLAAALRLAEEGRDVDPVAVLTEVIRAGEVTALGTDPANYVHDVLAAALPGWEWHARRVRQVHARNALVAVLTSARQAAEDPGFGFDATVDRLRDELDKLASPDGTRPLRTMRELVQEVLDDLESEEDRGIGSPWADLDDAIGGLVPGQVVVLGARPATGKSMIGAQWAAHVAMELRVPVLFASLEMPDKEVTARLISAKARVPLSRLLRRKPTEDDWFRLAKYTEEVSDSPLLIDDTERATIAHIRSRLRGMNRTAKAGLLVVDTLTKVAESEPSAESVRLAVAATSSALRHIAREFGIPVIILAQLRRDAANRKPTKEDLSESSQIESDADIVLLLHRPDLGEDGSARAGEIDVIVSKNRQGGEAIVTLAWQGHYGRVVDLRRHPQAQSGGVIEDLPRWAS